MKRTRLVMADAATKLEASIERITETGCWIWTGATKGGAFPYGHFCLKGKLTTTHRASFEAFNGPIPDGFCVCHKCDIPLCCNPAHLFVGTKRDNFADMRAKGRLRAAPLRGAKHHKTALTEDDVRVMRFMWSLGFWSQSQLGVLFSVKQTSVLKIVRRQRWSHI